MISTLEQANSEQELMNNIYKLSDAGASVIQVRTREPIRTALTLRRSMVDGTECFYTEWDVINGFRTFTKENLTENLMAGNVKLDNQESFFVALQHPLNQLRNSSSIVTAQKEAVHYFVYVNAHPYVHNNPIAIEQMMQYAAILPSTNVCLIFITPEVSFDGMPAGTIMTTDMKTPSATELEALLRRIVGHNQEDFPDTNVTDEEMTQIAQLGLGLTLFEFETYAAIAVVDIGLAKRKEITAEDLMAGIAVGKTEVVKQSEILELYPTVDMSEVGGMQRLKDWLASRSTCFSQEARDFGIEAPSGIAVVGVPGCLSGDTILDYKRGDRPSARPISMKDFYAKFNGLPTSTRPWDDTSLPTYLHSVDGNGRVFFNRVIAVLDSGVKATIKISFDDGSHLVLTADHPVLTEDWDFVQAGGLAVGDAVIARGSMKPQMGEGRNLQARPPRSIINVKNHPHGAVKRVADNEDCDYVYKRVPRARLVVEAHMNNMSYDAFLARLQSTRSISDLRFLEPIYEVHHCDENTMHDELNNLVVMHKIEHAREHGKFENFNVEYTKLVTVTAIEDFGFTRTYDIQMEAPANNFVANGIIVHNTGKSLIAKAVASEFAIPLVRFSVERVFSKYVGDSESRVRSALAMVEAMAPCVLFIDEIDKGLSGTANGGDGGTSSRVLGTILTWLNDCKAPVFTMVTANRVEGLPPELLRKGRFDQVFSVGLSNPEERKQVLDIHLRKRGHEIEFDKNDMGRFVHHSDGYVPAEIEAAVKDALILAFSEGEGATLEMRHIVSALEGMIPMSVSNAAQIEQILEWARTNAIPVNYPASLPGTEPTLPGAPIRRTRLSRGA